MKKEKKNNCMNMLSKEPDWSRAADTSFLTDGEIKPNASTGI